MSVSGLGVAQRIAPDETVCGDAYELIEVGSTTTIAIADGLGHGPEAATAAQLFLDIARERAGDDLEEILRSAHRALVATRGAAAALLRFDRVAATLEFSGVGNIEVRARARHPVAPICTPGVVGGRLKRTSSFRYTIVPGDLVVVHSDGIRGVNLDALAPLRPQPAADRVLEQHYIGRDDATCLVLRV